MGNVHEINLNNNNDDNQSTMYMNWLASIGDPIYILTSHKSHTRQPISICRFRVIKMGKNAFLCVRQHVIMSYYRIESKKKKIT